MFDSKWENSGIFGLEENSHYENIVRDVVTYGQYCQTYRSILLKGRPHGIMVKMLN